ncbi:MAG: tRNA (adenosine(37)-N6)-dimethylallyltransferase MiaA [Boseongicola sp.]|nr:MAG: tRNA (adenosine(37)-N6)-dimethylallyltransferase MiaA [Boseongicola sp.]
MRWIESAGSTLSGTRPILIAGPTASGKSALAMYFADRFDGQIINADAIQVYSDWRVLTARPSIADEKQVQHQLYGHILGTTPYSTGQWLREVAPLLTNKLPIIVGGTGLNFAALTEGLADIPPTPEEIRKTANERVKTEGFRSLLAELDSRTAQQIDRNNPMRVQRAWEVLAFTGRSLFEWQSETPDPVLRPEDADKIVVCGSRENLLHRIESRFDKMLSMGVLEEAKANASQWQPDQPSAKAIGASELITHVKGNLSLELAKERIVIQTRQYAKRQRSWFRGRMGTWTWIDPDNQ